MKITYVGEELATKAFGVTFVQGEPKDVSDLDAAFIAKLKANPQFEVAKAKKEVSKAPESPANPPVQ